MNNNFKSIIIDPGHGGLDIGFSNDGLLEKDFNLEVAKYIYNKLNLLGFPVYITRLGDYTISNYDRYEYINEIVDDNEGGALIISVQLDNEKPNDISIIRSIKSNEDTNKELYNRLNNIGEVKVKTLPNVENKDFYAIQRLTPDESESFVIEFGYNYLNNSEDEKMRLGEEIADAIISFLGNINFNNLGYESYVVQKGDNLYRIAKKYNTTVDNLRKVNSLGTDFLSIGQVLKVPKLKENIYVVKKGDSLYSIAKKFNTEVDKIKDINNLISNKLLVNQKILIPN